MLFESIGLDEVIKEKKREKYWAVKNLQYLIDGEKRKKNKKEIV